MKKVPVRLLWWVLLAPLGYLLQWATTGVPHLIEAYYIPVYLPFTQLSSRIAGFFPFSIAEFGLLLLVVVLPVLFVRHLVSGIRKKNYRGFLTFLVQVVVISSVWYFLSVPAWSLNYNRPTFGELSGLHVKPSSSQDLIAVATILADKVSYLRTLVSEDENGVMQLADEGNQFLRRTSSGYDAVAKQYPFLGGQYGNPKSVVLSEWMSRTHIIGIYTVTTAEANIDAHMPPLFRPSTAMHELAHMRGFAREDEANFIAWLTANAHPDTDFQYSGNLLALIHVSNALYGENQEAYHRVMATLSDGIRRDLAREQQYWNAYESVVNKVAEATNDAYLKFNRQADGVKSYGRMVDLILAEYSQNPQLSP